MSGWNLTEGQYNTRSISEDEIWSHFNFIFSNKSKNTTSYKFCFIKALLENLFNVDEYLGLSFYCIYYKFTEIYWNLIVKYKLTQVTRSFKKSKVEIIIETFCNKYMISDETSFEALRIELQNELVRNVSAECKRCVIGALYADSKGSFYSFSLKDEVLKFNPLVYSFMVKYKSIINKLNYFEWVKFLEKVNNEETVYAIAEKLDYSSKREDLSIYKDLLYNEFQIVNCFYCNKPVILTRHLELDHFVPWSYVKDDKIWNLVISCRECNNRKRDKLAIVNYIDKIIDQNKIIESKKTEIYLIENDFKGYHPSKLRDMYSSAKFNGFEFDWKPQVVYD